MHCDQLKESEARQSFSAEMMRNCRKVKGNKDLSVQDSVETRWQLFHEEQVDVALQSRTPENYDHQAHSLQLSY